MFIVRQTIHFIGIGGAGMCPMAEILLRQGHHITGSELQRSQATARLESLGIQVQYDHRPELIRAARLCVYSSAVHGDNEELVFAKTAGIRCMKRAEMLGELMRSKFSIAIAGTHGKTTTTALLGTLFHDAGYDPSVLVGGMMQGQGSHAIVGESNLLITEADEYDRSFLRMYPCVAIITNIEEDHLDIYKDLDDITRAFMEFICRVPFYGSVVVCIDDPTIRRIHQSIQRTVITYGVSSDAVYRAESIHHTPAGMSFVVKRDSTTIGQVALALRGIHNVRNACAVIATAMELGVEFSAIASSLARFKGVKRRFEILGTAGGVTVIDDYAHHPSEISATLRAAANAGYQRIIVAFQPHLYSRTNDFFDAFAQSLGSADIVFVSEIYKAREEPLPGVSGKMIVDAMAARGFNQSFFHPLLQDIVEAIVASARSGDAIILMGAGDIWSIGATLLERIR